MGEEKIMDQVTLAEDLSSKISYEFIDQFLVKPLDPIKVKKEFSKPVSEKEPTKDAEGIEAVDYDKVETEVKEVDSDYRKGVVLKVPTTYDEAMADEKVSRHMGTVKVGDIVLFRDRAGVFFDLLKDSKLIRYYDIVAIEK